MDKYDLDLSKLVEKPKIIKFPNGEVATVYKPTLQQVISLALVAKKYQNVDLENLEDESILNITKDIADALEDVIPAMKGQNLSMFMMTKLMDVILEDAIPTNNAKIEIDGGDVIGEDQKKISGD